MDPKFSIKVDRKRDLVTVVMSGLLRPEDVADFFAARRKAHAQLSCVPGRHVTLTDLRTMMIQPQETVSAFAELLTDPQSRARRLAFVVSPTLLRSQLLRALAGRDSRCFDDMAQAEAWLMEEDDISRETRIRSEAARNKPTVLRSVA